MGNYHQSEEELRQHLIDQVMFLKASSKSFDNGFEAEAKRLAIAIRILLHDTSKSNSLLGQLKLKEILFIDTASDWNSNNLESHSGLVIMQVSSSGSKYIARLDDMLANKHGKTLPFDEWWNKIVFVLTDRTKITRKGLILSAADKDGGAHVDPSLDESYSKLSRKCMLGWTSSRGKLVAVELASIRQIAHEVIKSLQPTTGISPPIAQREGALFGDFQVYDSKSNSSSPALITKKNKTGRNNPCPCGSGKKYKKCCGASES